MSRAVKEQKKPKQLPYDTQSFFCRQMAFVVKAGVPLSKAHEFLKNEAENYDSLNIIEQIFSTIDDEGSSFSLALRKTGYFSEYLVSVVSLGEKTGHLEQALYELANYFDQLQSVKRKITDAFRYPLILFLMMFSVIIFLIIEVLPQFAMIISNAGGQLPAVASVVLNMGQFVKTNFIYFIIGILAVILALYFYAKSKKGKGFIDSMSLKPYFFGKTTRKLATTRFCFAMKLALANGNNFSTSVNLTADIINNNEVKKRLLKLKDLIDEGIEVPAAVAKINLFPKSFVSLFSTAYKTGNLDTTLERMASYYQDSFDDAIYSITSKIEPALVILLSFLAGMILFSVMIPIINIMQLIG